MPIVTDKKWTIYIVENRLNHYYTGICRNLARRFEEHSSGGKLCAKALRGKTPLTLVYAAELTDHSTALKAEIWIKKLTKAQKIQLVNHQKELSFTHVRQNENHIQGIMHGNPQTLLND